MADDAGIAGPPSSARPKSARRKLYEVHSWLGFHLAALMALVLATGTIATISHEIDWLMQHDMRVTPDGEHVSWGDMHKAVEAHRPKASIISLSEMDGDHFAYRARVVDPYGRHDFVHVNQWTGEVTGETHPLTVQRVFRDLHRYLFMPNFIGLPIVTSLAFVLAVSLYTGLKTSRNWRTLLVRVRTDKGARIMWGDAHKAAGLWSIWFFVVMIITGVWYLIEFGAAASGSSVQAPRASVSIERSVEFGSVIPNRNADEIIEAATSAYSDWRPTLIFFPTRATDPIEVQGDVGNPIIRDRANRVFLDPADLSIIKVQRSEEIGWASYLNEMADPLHFGFFAGLPTKLIWFVFGVAMTGLSITGVWLTWKRLKSAAPSKTQFATLPVLVVSMLFATAWYDRLQGPSIPKTEIATERVQNGDVVARLLFAVDKAGGITGHTRLEVSADDGRPNLREVRISVVDGDATAEDQAIAPIRALRRVTEARLILDPSELSGANKIVGEFEFASGETRSFDWALDLEQDVAMSPS